VAETSFEQPMGEEEYRIQFKVYRIDGTQTWSIVDVRQQGLGYSYTRLHHWSHDSQYFYFSGFFVADGGCSDLYPALSVWQRLDVVSGEVSDYPLPDGRGHALSPDDTTLAYASVDTPVQIHLRDLASGIEQVLPLPLPEPVAGAAQAGRLTWSPDDAAVIAAAASHNTLCSDIRPTFSLWRVNVNPLEAVALVAPGDVLIRPLAWPVAERILVGDWNGLTWWMDSETGQPTTAPEN
jgi:hypothetical protein